jgi:hypothetical protein
MGSRYNAYGRFRAVRYSKLYWLDIDVALRNILYRRRTEPARVISCHQFLSLEYCVLEGVGAVANVLNVGQEPGDIDQFVVHIAGYTADEEDISDPELRPSARMVWNNMNEHSLRSDIYISSNLMRHLVELYVTKRIDRVQLSIQIAVIGDHIGKLDVLPEGFPLLGEAGRLHFRRKHCDLLSVYTSLAKT